MTLTLTLWPINSGVLTSLLLPHLSSSLADSVSSLNLICHSKTHTRFMQNGRKGVWSIQYVSVAFFPSLKQNLIAYHSSKVSSRPDCIFAIHQLWQSGFSRVYSYSCSSRLFEPEIIQIGQSSLMMYSNNILNFKYDNFKCLYKKSLETYWINHVYIYIYIGEGITGCLSRKAEVFEWIEHSVAVTLIYIYIYIYIKDRKAAALNEIPPEVWKTRQFDDILLPHCNAVYNQNPIDRWMKGCILPFPKKCDLGLAQNNRAITLTSIAAKIYDALLRNRIEPKIDNILGKNQNGFRRNRSMTSQILTIRRILEGVRAKNLQATLLFVDFAKAFDSIHRTNPTSIQPTKRNRSSNNDSLQKHLSEGTFTEWRHRILRHCSRSTTRGHASPVPLYHLPRLRA